MGSSGTQIQIHPSEFCRISGNTLLITAFQQCPCLTGLRSFVGGFNLAEDYSGTQSFPLSRSGLSPNYPAIAVEKPLADSSSW